MKFVLAFRQALLLFDGSYLNIVGYLVPVEFERDKVDVEEGEKYKSYQHAILNTNDAHFHAYSKVISERQTNHI